ncbi:MAG: hypothetical protein J1F35_03615 [Erysipelotrichales bacterium]|nr:hypothetical protein [Erysipelotrichales bacterium]
MQDKTSAIIIPIYEDEFDIIIKTSLDSLIKNSSEYTKKQYPIILIGPNKLKQRIEQVSDYLKKSFSVSSRLYEDYFFESTASYSRLLKTHDFYLGFKDFDYILIYQTDCLMIHDNLKIWINKGYDYIGAPILSQNAGWKKVPIVGNGGCSLRKISYFLDVTNPKGKFLTKYQEKLDKEISGRGPEGYKDFEDLYFAELIAYYYGMDKPKYLESLDFAFDMNPDVAKTLKKDSKSFPDFLHAYDKNLRFYNTINQFKENINDYEVLYNFCEKKYQELHKYYQTDL